MSRERFQGFLQEAILSLPQTLKVLLRLAEDPDLRDDMRMAAAGTCMHFLSASNTIPGVRGILGYVDDVLVSRLVLERLVSIAPEAMERYRTASPELLSHLESDLGVIRGYLGKSVSVLEKTVDELDRVKFKGWTVERCVQEEEGGNWLYDEVQSALVELDLEEAEVARALKDLDEIVSRLEQRLR